MNLFIHEHTYNNVFIYFHTKTGSPASQAANAKYDTIFVFVVSRGLQIPQN